MTMENSFLDLFAPEKNKVKHIKVCAKCHHEGSCLKGVDLECDYHDFPHCDKIEKPCNRSESSDCESCNSCSNS